MKTSAELCRENNWVPGTRLSHQTILGKRVIEITAVGEHQVLAKSISLDGFPQNLGETAWTLTYSQWAKEEVVDDAVSVSLRQVVKSYVDSLGQLLYFKGETTLDHHEETHKTSNGGVYYLTLSHVRGPKINLEKTVGDKLP